MKGALQAQSHDASDRRSWYAAFTIVEVMIVLAVTGLLFASAAVLISGKENQAEFNQGVQQFQSQIEQIINDVATGYYPNLGNFSCTNTGGSLTITAGGSVQGTNGDCLFLGKVLQFGSGVAGTTPEQFATFSVTGLRADASGNQLSTLSSTSPTVIPSSTTTTQLEGGLTTYDMWYNGNPANKIAAVAFVSTLGQASGSGVLTGTQQVNVVPITGTALTQNTGITPATIHSVLSSPAAVTNPANGVEICFASGGTNQSALITIGNNSGSGRELGVTLNVKAGRIC